jgi:hypothetical protein
MALSTPSNVGKNSIKSKAFKSKIQNSKKTLCKDNKFANHNDLFFKCAQYIQGIYIG